MCTVTISDEQVKQIANSIIVDVRHYVTNHREEYEKFLADELIANDDHPELENIERKDNLDGKS